MSENKIIVKAGVVVPAHDLPALTDAAVVVDGDKIIEVGPYKDLAPRHPGAREIGGSKYLAIPGLVNGHSHGRGLTDFQRGALDNTLESWLLDGRKYLPIETYDDCALSAVRLLKSGVTTTMHNHILKDPAGYDDEFDQAVKAYLDAGMRVQFNPGVRNANPFIYGDNAAFLAGLPDNLREMLTRPLPEGALNGENFVPVTQAMHSKYNSEKCIIGFGPLAPQWATDELLKQVRAAADELSAPIHVHAVQSIYQKMYGLKQLGKTLIAHMNDLGFLGPGLVIGHCVWPTEEDIKMMADTRTGVTHHPSCNLRVRNGIAPAWHMLRAGVRVGLGLDGKSINDDDDFLQEMKVCYLLGRLPSLELDSPHLTARDVFKMGTENSAALLGFGDLVGRLEPGRLADLALLDYEKICWPFVDPGQDPVDVLMYRANSRHVDTVMVGGQIVVQDGRVVTVNEEEIGQRLAESVSRPRTETELAVASAMDVLKAAVKKYYAGWTEQPELKPFYKVNSRVDGL